MKKCLLSATILIIVVLLCIPGAMAMSTQEKETKYNAAILALEDYLESNRHDPHELEQIAAGFDDLQFEHSKSFKVYIYVLIRVENNEFDMITDAYLTALDSERFNKAVENLTDSPIGPSQELSAYVHGREYEYEGDVDKACEYYGDCMAFFDTQERYVKLIGEKAENTYQKAIELFRAGKFPEAKELFQSIVKYKDSSVYLEMVSHVWVEADCEHPRTCTHCGKTEGEPLGHDWQAATCTAAKTCARCGKTSGKKLGHDWQDATCTTAKTCKRCGATSGKALGHDWAIIDCEHPLTCARCGKTDGDAVGHDWQAATCTAPKTCARCGKTTGKALGHNWQDATCTAPKTCARCGKTNGNALGHDWQEATYSTPKICKRCKVTKGDRLPMPEYADQSKDFEYRIDGPEAIITKYNGTEKVVCIPSSLGGKPVKSIPGDIFSYMGITNMEVVIIPDGVTTIKDAAFYDCGLTAIYLPASLTSIGNEAFTYCTRLGWIQVDPGNKHFTVKDGVLFTKSMDTLIRHFNQLGSKNYTVPKGVKNIAAGAFTRCSLETITLPEGLESIGRLAFEGCEALRSISIPSTVTGIGDYAFLNNAMDNIKVSSKNKNYASRDGVLFSKNFDTLIQYPLNKPDQEYTIPDTVKKVNDGALQYCSFEKLTLSKNMTSIDDGMFYPCFNLRKVELFDGITHIGGMAFGYATDLTIYIPTSVTSIDKQAFFECENVTIEGKKGSYAQKYAEQNHIPFVAR